MQFHCRFQHVPRRLDTIWGMALPSKRLLIKASYKLLENHWLLLARDVRIWTGLWIRFNFSHIDVISDIGCVKKSLQAIEDCSRQKRDSNSEVENIRIRLRNLEGTVSELGMKVKNLSFVFKLLNNIHPQNQNERLKIANEDLELRTKQANQIADQAREVKHSFKIQKDKKNAISAISWQDFRIMRTLKLT